MRCRRVCDNALQHVAFSRDTCLPQPEGGGPSERKEVIRKCVWDEGVGSVSLLGRSVGCAGVALDRCAGLRWSESVVAHAATTHGEHHGLIGPDGPCEN